MKTEMTCPKCKGKIVWCNSGTELWCEKCRLVIRNNFVDKAFIEGVRIGRQKLQTEIKDLLRF